MRRPFVLLAGVALAVVRDTPLSSTAAPSSWMRDVQVRIAASEYEIRKATGSLEATNRAHGLRVGFESTGTVLRDRTGDDPPLQLRASAWGRGQSREALAPVDPAIGACRGDGAQDARGHCLRRVERTYEGLTEWWENRSDGLEHGFTVKRRPSKDPRSASSTRLVPSQGTERVLDVTNDLFVDVDLLGGHAEVERDGRSAILARADGRRRRYGGLVAIDASGRTLPAQMARTERGLRLRVEDEGARYPVTIDPLLTGSAWMAESDQAGALLGFDVASAGDVNGDGFSDVVVGAPLYSNGESSEGGAFVYAGSAGGLSATATWTLEPNQADAQMGYSVASAGDVNGDGFGDVISGAPYYDNSQSDEGAAFVFLGSASGLSTTASSTLESNQIDAHLGFSVAAAGDTNGDGFAEIIVGAPNHDNGETDEGAAFVSLGAASGLATTATWTVESNQSLANFGGSVASAGDVNGDGYGDLIVGAPNYDDGETDEGAAFVYLGSAAGLGAAPAWTIESNQAGAAMGFSAASAGDVNGDGFGDVIVGADFYNDGQVQEGVARVYLGSAAGLAATAVWNGEIDQAYAWFGTSVASAGDVNGDGYGDVIVGGDNWTNGEPQEGKAWVYLGSDAGVVPSSPWYVEPEQSGAYYGISVASAGDVNGDGYAEIIVGASQYDNGETDEGTAMMYLGNRGDRGYAFGLRPQQRQSGQLTPIPPMGRAFSNSFDVAAVARTPLGRARGRLQVEAKPTGAPFSGTGFYQSSSWTDLGVAGTELVLPVTDLIVDAGYHWRARVQYDPSQAPPQPWSQWLYGGLSGQAQGVHLIAGPVDAGPPPPLALRVGCDCNSTGGALFVLAGLLAVLTGRRRR